jgi:hypothetical protein
MTYIRHDKDNNQVTPQPVSIARTFFSGSEGWSTVTSYDWSGDYQRHDVDNNPAPVGTYQRHDVNNNPVGLGTYQRHDKDNNPIYQ